MTVDYDRLHAVIENLAGGPSDSAGDRAAAVVLAQVNAFEVGPRHDRRLPGTDGDRRRVAGAADELPGDDRDPVDVLTRVATI